MTYWRHEPVRYDRAKCSKFFTPLTHCSIHFFKFHPAAAKCAFIWGDPPPQCWQYDCTGQALSWPAWHRQETSHHRFPEPLCPTGLACPGHPVHEWLLNRRKWWRFPAHRYAYENEQIRRDRTERCAGKRPLHKNTAPKRWLCRMYGFITQAFARVSSP